LPTLTLRSAKCYAKVVGGLGVGAINGPMTLATFESLRAAMLDGLAYANSAIVDLRGAVIIMDACERNKDPFVAYTYTSTAPVAVVVDMGMLRDMEAYAIRAAALGLTRAVFLDYGSALEWARDRMPFQSTSFRSEQARTATVRPSSFGRL
jgi:hypothetical protein